jgi:hypothetical protein
MSIYKSSSLAMIPTAYKDGKLYSIRPTDGSGDFTFSRGSNLAATRVDVNGLIEKGRENLLLQSNQFGTTWANASSTETSGQAGYDGTNNAWLLNKTATGGRIQQSIVVSGVHTASVYVKAGTLNWFLFLITSTGGDEGGYFDLSTGNTGTQFGSQIDIKTEAIGGGGWYRCSFTANINTSNTIRIYPANGNNDVSGSGSIYIQDAQLEQGLVATDYIETGTSAAQSGILEDMPRLDYSGGASCPSLLLEPSRTNLVNYSEYFNLYTQYGSPTITPNAIQSPEGLVNATKVQRGSNETPIRRSNITTLGTEYTMSLWAKAGTATKIRIEIGDETAPTYNLTSEWQRIDVTSTPNTYTHLDIAMPLSSSGDYFYIYGLQLEVGSYPTSYIPTYGTSQTIARDEAYKTGVSSLIGQTEGTLFVDFDLLRLDGFSGIIDINTALTTTATRVLLWETGGTSLSANFGTQAPSINLNNPTIGRHKVVIIYSASICKLFVDGVKIGESSTSGSFSGLDVVSYVCAGGGVNFQKKNIHQTLLFPTALTDSECIALTTL